MEIPSERPQLHAPESKEFESKVIVITGGASGIGRSTAEAFAQQGAHVVVLDISSDSQLLEGLDYRKVDVSDWAAVEKTINDIATQFGGIDYVVNNAAMKVSGTILDVSSETFEKLLRVNALGFWNVAKAAIPHLIESHGTLINVCSGTSESLPPNTDAYFGSKGTTYSLTHALAASFGEKIAIRGIAPGPVDTPLWREGKSPAVIEEMLAGKLGPKVETPDAIAENIIYLASRNNASLNGKILRL